MTLARTAPDETPPTQRAASLGWPIVLAWIALYLLMMAHGGWHWAGTGILDFGTPSSTALDVFGAPVPTKIHAGEWQRLLLGPWLQHSLLGLVLLTFFWSSMARTLVGLFGRARVWLLFVAGGVAGALTHAWAHPEGILHGGAGPFDPIAAGLGAQLMWGFASRDPRAPRVRNGAIVSVLIIGALLWFFTRDSGRGEQVRELMGFEAMLGAFGMGLVLMLVFGPRRSQAPAGRTLRVASFLALAALAAAGVVQAPRAIASGERGAVQSFLKRLQKAELAAISLRDQREATEEKRATLESRLQEVLQSDFLEDYDGAQAVRVYVEKMRAYTQPVRLPYMARDPCRSAFREMYEEYERPLREKVGIRPRYDSEHYWERD